MVDTFLDMAADSLVPVLSGTHSSLDGELTSPETNHLSLIINTVRSDISYKLKIFHFKENNFSTT